MVTNRMALMFVLCFSIVLNPIRAEVLVDPLRGESIERLLSTSKSIFLVQIDSAKRQSAFGLCKYDYAATITEIYKQTDINKKPFRQKKLLFSSAARFRVDDNILVISRKDSSKLNLTTQEREKCKQEVAIRLGKEGFTLTSDEFVPVVVFHDRYYAFLPIRYFWAAKLPVATRRIGMSKEELIMLGSADGSLDGDFYLLDDLLKSITGLDKK